jgi:hypothetical protein
VPWAILKDTALNAGHLPFVPDFYFEVLLFEATGGSSGISLGALPIQDHISL